MNLQQELNTVVGKFVSYDLTILSRQCKVENEFRIGFEPDVNIQSMCNQIHDEGCPELTWKLLYRYGLTWQDNTELIRKARDC